MKNILIIGITERIIMITIGHVYIFALAKIIKYQLVLIDK